LGSYSAQKLQYSTRIRNAYSVCLLAELETLVKLLDVSAFLFLVRCVQCSWCSKHDLPVLNVCSIFLQFYHISHQYITGWAVTPTFCISHCIGKQGKLTTLRAKLWIDLHKTWSE